MFQYPILNWTKLALMVFFPYGPNGPLGQEWNRGRESTVDKIPNVSKILIPMESLKIVPMCALWQRDSKVNTRFYFFFGIELGLF